MLPFWYTFFASFFVGSLLSYCSANYFLLLLPLEPKRATTIAVAIAGKEITIGEALEKRSHKPIYKIDIKNEEKILKVTTFDILKLEEP